jgi:type II secretory pathway component GspD/PulD (secretin)
VAYLAQLVAAALPDLAVGRGASGNDASGLAPLDVLILSGSYGDVGRAMELLPQLDIEQDQVALVAAVYEVATGSERASALSLALSLFSGRLGIGNAASGVESLVRLATSDLAAVFGVLSTDNRFRAVTSPSLLVRSGAEATLASGSQVPVLGAVTYPGDGGQPVQSVEYRDSGVVLRVRPVVHGETIDLDISQELSSFVRTDTGVNGSPTLNRRALTNRLTLRSGEIVVLGGLTERRHETSRDGPLPFLGSRSRSVRDVEVIVVLQVTRLAGGARPQRSEDARRPASSVP